MKKYVGIILLTAMLSMSFAGCGVAEIESSSDSDFETTTNAGTDASDEEVFTETEATEAATKEITEAVTDEVVTETTAEAVITEIVTEVSAETETSEIYQTKEVFALNGPMARKQSVNEFDNAGFAASFGMNDLTMAENGAYTLTVMIYGYEYFSADDILSLNVGDTIYCLGQPVVIETIEAADSRVKINGGIENGGRFFKTDDNTVYYESGMSDRKSYYSIGENTYTLSENFTMTDNAVMEYPKTYTAEEFAALSDDVYGFRNNNTIVNTVDGVISSIVRNYTP